jgi:hypothetical protein
MSKPKTTIQIELTKTQKEQIWAATGRNVNVLALRLQGWTKNPRLRQRNGSVPGQEMILPSDTGGFNR